MSDSPSPPSTDHLLTLVRQGKREEALTSLDALVSATTVDRKEALRALKMVAEDRPAAFESLTAALSRFLNDDDRSVRLTTAKLFVTLAKSEPTIVLPVVAELADRLADEDEFYYVRARSAEALGYVALEHPEEVASPELLADLRIGLSFDEPEVKEKLAKALEYFALGDPARLRHQVSTLADHLDDENELVRYHLSTALVAVGSEYPGRLTADRGALVARLDDQNDHVRGRAAEALGLLAQADSDEIALPEVPQIDQEENKKSFVGDRMRFALEASSRSDISSDVPAKIGTLDGVRETTADALDAITSPDGEEECPHCGLALPDDGPPMCPRCGAPY